VLSSNRREVLSAQADSFVNINPSLLTDVFYELYKAKFMGLISTSEAAEKLGVHITRVQVLIREGRLPAQRIGRTYVIDEADLKLVEDRKVGRPRKAQSENASKQKSAKKGKNK
jgi:excisionase family DNA binding protein